MLPREYRLPPDTNTRPSFSYKSSLFIVKMFASPLPQPRFGFIVSKKVSGKAIKRNRIKRQVRSVIEQLLPRISPGYDILFIVHKTSLEAPREVLEEQILQFLTKKGLLI